MQQFKLQPGLFPEVRRKILMRLIPIAFLGIIFVVVINVFDPKNEDPGFNPLIISVPFIVVMLTVLFYMTIVRQKKMYESYRLHISESMISREQLNTPTVGISPIEVSEIVLNHDKSFTIKSNSTRNTIIVPAQIDNYAEVKRLLGEIVPVTTITKKSFLEKYQFLFIIASLAMMVTVYISFNKILVAICGTGVIALLVYSFLASLRNNNLDNRARLARWFIWIVVASVAFTMYIKLTNDFSFY
jgi:hypothetical protein